jgi:hypothetical protein
MRRVMSDLPDEDFVRKLYAMYGDEGWGTTLARGFDPAWEEELGPLDEDARAAFAELGDPRRLYSGTFIGSLRSGALAILQDETGQTASIPIALLPTRQLNALSVASPRGGAVILLNSSVLWMLPMLFSLYTALDSWQRQDGTAKEFSPEQLADGLIRLAVFAATDDLTYLRSSRVVVAPSDERLEELMNLILLAEHFLLLHEYGHVVLGHLNHDRTVLLGAIDGEQVAAFDRVVDDEYEADAFAVSRLLRASSGRLRPTDVAIGPGLLLNFFALVELVVRSLGTPHDTSHPPALQRWVRVQAMTELEKNPDAYAARFAFWFDRLRDVCEDLLSRQDEQASD